MKLYLSRESKSINAVVEWDQVSNTFTVLKGSLVSDSIATNTTFRSVKTIEKIRGNGNVVDRKLMINVTFKSASSAANFITGSSTNGLTALKDNKGRTLKSIITETKSI